MNIKKLSKIGYGFLIAFMVLVGGLLIFSMVPIEGNFQIKIVLSGSMEPAIKTGSVVIIKPVDRYGIGDVVIFGKDNRDNIPTTHRIVEMHIISGETRFITKGDANDDLDGREITERDIIGKVLFDVPYVGFILDIARKPLGFAVLIGIPALVIMSDEVVKIYREAKKLSKAKKENKVIKDDKKETSKKEEEDK